MSTAPHPFTQKQQGVATNPFEHRHQRRRLRIGIWAGGIVLVAAVGFYLYALRQQTGILILEQPNTALNVTINGRGVVPEIVARGYYVPLYAGTYRLEITKGGQLSFTQDVLTEPGKVIEVRPSYNLLTNLPSNARSATVDFLRPSLDQSSVYFLGDSGRRLYQYAVGSQQQIPLTDTVLSDVRNVQWNGKPSRALITTGSGLYIQEIDRYNFTTQNRRKIAGTEFASAAWDPNEADRLAAAYYPGTGEKSLVLIDSLFSNIRRIGSLTDLPATPHIIWSPNSAYLALLPQSTNPADQNIWLTDLATNITSQITKQGDVREVTFNVDGTALLYLVSENNQLVRKFSSIDGKTVKTVTGAGRLQTLAWKDASSFYEPNEDGSRIVLTNALTGAQRVAVNISNASEIQSMYYYPKTNTLIFATKTSIYSVAVE